MSVHAVIRSIQDHWQLLCEHRKNYVEPANEKMYRARLERDVCEARVDRELAAGQSAARQGISKFVRYVRVVVSQSLLVHSSVCHWHERNIRLFQRTFARCPLTDITTFISKWTHLRLPACSRCVQRSVRDGITHPPYDR